MRKTVMILWAMMLMASPFVRAAESDVVWQIGKTDRDYHEFGNSGDLFGAYLKAFPKDVDFVVGKSDGSKDFSASHPGPVDAWAGSRQHEFRVTFDLPESRAAAYQLRIDIVDTQGTFGPTLRVKVNDQAVDIPLERGTGDISVLHPDKGKPRALKFTVGGATLKPAGNVISLTVTAGSWIIYDALSFHILPTEANAPIQLTAKPSMFFVERDGQLRQEVALLADGVLGADPLKVEVRDGDRTLDSATLGIPSLGTVSGPLLLTPADAERELSVTVSAGSQTGTVKITQKPQRKWRIYCAPSTHTDIGYTAHQSLVIALHNRNTDLALELSDEFPLYHWNLESSWAAQMWLRDNPAYRHEALYKAAREHRVGIESSYLNMLTGLCSEEELIRTMYYSARLNREHGVPFDSYTLTDAPSHVWTLPSILAGAGIKYISIGSNQTRAPILKKNIHHKCPFWWEGPDGQRILTWNSNGYSQAGQIGLREGMARMRQAIENDLLWWSNRTDYPYDAILLHGAYSDNVAIGRDIAESITEYSKHYAYPKVILCSNDVFLKYIEQNFADKIPVVRGCGGSWWEDGAGSTAYETGQNRVAHQEIVVAETAWAVTAGTDNDTRIARADFDRAWDNMLLYDEHTWGAHNSITQPEQDFVHRQWATKALYGTDAADTSSRLLQRGLVRLAERIKAPDDSLLVFNSSGRIRTGLVHADIQRKMQILDDDGQVVPAQIVREDVLNNVTVVFEAKDVPAVGYRTYRLAAASSSAEAPERFSGKVLENDFYRVEFDEATGGIKSLTDKKLGKDLVDPASKYKFGQLVYATSDKCEGQYFVDCPNIASVKFHSPTSAAIAPGSSGPVYSSVKTVAGLPIFPRIEMETILYERERRINFIYRLNKKMTYDKEAVYLAFPFAGEKPQFRYEIGGGSVRPNEDHWPGGCRDWFSVQRWVTVKTETAAVAWSPLDTPLITLCDMSPGKWYDELPVTNGTIFAYIMNNYWCTNYKAGQDGDFTFRYSLTSDADMSPAAASLFGEDVQAPMRAIRLFAKRDQQTLPSSMSFCEVEPANVMTTTVKPADDGDGIILRVREIAGQATDVVISVRFPGVTRASRCDLVEKNKDSLTIEQGKVRFPIQGNSMATIRLKMD